MRIVLEHFAILCDLAGCASESVETGSTTPQGLWEETRSRLDVRLERSAFRAVRNDEFVEWDAPLSEGDRVSFLPPFAGG